MILLSYPIFPLPRSLFIHTFFVVCFFFLDSGIGFAGLGFFWYVLGFFFCSRVRYRDATGVFFFSFFFLFPLPWIYYLFSFSSPLPWICYLFYVVMLYICSFRLYRIVCMTLEIFFFRYLCCQNLLVWKRITEVCKGGACT